MKNSFSFLLRASIALALLITPSSADAKPKKDEKQKQKKEQNAKVAQAQKKITKAPQKPVRSAEERPKAPAKVARPKSVQPKATAGPPNQHRPSTVSKTNKRAAKIAASQKSEQDSAAANVTQTKENRAENARKDAVEKMERDARRADRGAADEQGESGNITDHVEKRRVAGEKREGAGNRAERRETREESAEARERRAERARIKERAAPLRKQQIAERRERARDRVERFRENRQKRLAAVARQRRAIRETRREARREYVEETREEIRDYWEDRAEETRYAVHDRCDDLFDDDWWENRSWHHHPIAVADPWWWWRPTPFDALNVFIGAGWTQPIAYDYGADVIYDEPVVHVRGEPVGTRVDYSNRVVQLANPAIPAVAEAPIVENDWRPLGVWALVQEAQGDATMFFQLSVDRKGLISGAYANVVSGEELPVAGQVDRETQRAAWHIGNHTSKVFEAGLANLTQEQASCLVHFEPGNMQTWLLVRLPARTLPDEPAALSVVGP